MDYGYLDSFHKRIFFAGRFYKLYAQIIKEEAFWKGCTWNNSKVFEDKDLQFNIVMAIFLHIFEMNLKDEACTIASISEFFVKVNREHFHIKMNYTPDEFTKKVVYNMLSFSGNIVEMSSYSFAEEEIITSPIRFINSRFDPKLNCSVFYMTDEGYSFILSTFEYEANLKIPIQQILFEQKLKEKDYKQAVSSIKTIFIDLKKQMRNIDELEQKIYTDVHLIDGQEFINTTNENIKSLRESGIKFNKFTEAVARSKEELNSAQITITDIDDKRKEDLSNLITIDTYLKKSLNIQQELLNKHFCLKEVYEKEWMNNILSYNFQGLSFEKDVFQSFLKNPELLMHGNIFFTPFYRMNFTKQFQLLSMMSLSDSIEEDETEDIEEYVSDEELTKQAEEKALFEARQYNLLRKTFSEFLLKKKIITFSEFLAFLTKEYLELSNISLVKQFLIELYSQNYYDLISDIDISELSEKEKNKFHNILYHVINENCKDKYGAVFVEKTSPTRMMKHDMIGFDDFFIWLEERNENGKS